MATRQLRSRGVVDYNALNSGCKSKKSVDISQDKDKLPAAIDILDQITEISPAKNTSPSSNSAMKKRLLALQLEEEKLNLELQVAKQKKDIDVLKSQLLNKSASRELCSDNPRTGSTEKITTQSLAQDKDLEAALNVLKDCHLSEFLENPQQEAIIPASVGKQINMSGPHLIPDNVSKPNVSYLNDKDRVKRIEEVTPAQWISANSKILLKLIGEGMNMDGVRSYLRYTSKIGDYLQVSEPSSVMLLDNEHRRQVYDESRQWHEIDGDKVYFHLKSASTANDNHRYHHKAQPTDDHGRTICLRYNRGSCFMTYCKFSHVCLLCKGDHPKSMHQNLQQVPHAPHIAQPGSAPQAPVMASAAAPPPVAPRFRHF